MSPVDGAVKCAVRVVLVEHMIFPLPLDKTIRIIHPIILRQEMEYRAVRIWRTLYVSIVYHRFFVCPQLLGVERSDIDVFKTCLAVSYKENQITFLQIV